MSFAPILIPIVFISLGTIVKFSWANAPDAIVGKFLWTLFMFLGKPVNALILGFIIALGLLPGLNKETLTGWIGEGIKQAGPIILITGAGGAFGAIHQSYSNG